MCTVYSFKIWLRHKDKFRLNFFSRIERKWIWLWRHCVLILMCFFSVFSSSYLILFFRRSKMRENNVYIYATELPYAVRSFKWLCQLRLLFAKQIQQCFVLHWSDMPIAYCSECNIGDSFWSLPMVFFVFDANIPIKSVITGFFLLQSLKWAFIQ